MGINFLYTRNYKYFKEDIAERSSIPTEMGSSRNLHYIATTNKFSRNFNNYGINSSKEKPEVIIKKTLFHVIKMVYLL